MALVDDWMPPDLDADVAAAFVAEYPTDPHAAAALAWEAYAATLPAEAGVVSVSTGAQSVTYGDGASAADAAMRRARWHRSRSRLRSVSVTRAPSRVIYGLHGEQPGWAADIGDVDTEDGGTIATYPSPGVGGIE